MEIQGICAHINNYVRHHGMSKLTVFLTSPQELYLGFQEGEMLLTQKDSGLNCSLQVSD